MLLFEMHQGTQPALHTVDRRSGVRPLITQLVQGSESVPMIHGCLDTR